MTKKISLRNYQEEAVSMLRAAISSDKSAVLQLSTGGGKTIIAAYILEKTAEAGLRCAFVVDRLSLIDQTSKVLDDYGIDHGIHQGDNEKEDDSKLIQVCSAQTLLKRKTKMFDLVIIDECHTWHGKVYERLIEEAAFAIGLSATPWRKGLGRYFNKLVIPIKTYDLVDQGFLVPHKVFGPPTVDLSNLRIVAGEFSEKSSADAADKKKVSGQVVSHWMKHARGRKTIVFAVNIAHANHLTKEFVRAGVKALTVNSHMKNKAGKGEVDSERKVIMDQFVEGDVEVIVSVDILSKGFDCPEVSCAVLVRPTNSLIVHVQQIGRALRPGGEPESIIIDHVGNNERLGFADEVDIETLDSGSQNQQTSIKKEREKPKPRACPSCDFMIPAGIMKCPACGVTCKAMEAMEETEEVLVEMDRKTARKQTIVEKQAFIASLNTYAYLNRFRQGRKGCYGWSIYAYRRRYGVLPSNKIQWNAVNKFYKIPDDHGAWIEKYNETVRKEREEEERKRLAIPTQAVANTSLPFL